MVCCCCWFLPLLVFHSVFSRLSLAISIYLDIEIDRFVNPCFIYLQNATNIHCISISHLFILTYGNFYFHSKINPRYLSIKIITFGKEEASRQPRDLGDHSGWSLFVPRPLRLLSPIPASLSLSLSISPPLCIVIDCSQTALYFVRRSRERERESCRRESICGNNTTCAAFFKLQMKRDN